MYLLDGGNSNIFYVHPLLGEMIQFDFLSDGLVETTNYFTYTWMLNAVNNQPFRIHAGIYTIQGGPRIQS